MPYWNDLAVRETSDGFDVAIDNRPAPYVVLDILFVEVDQTQTGHVHSTVSERRNTHLADALRAPPLITVGGVA